MFDANWRAAYATMTLPFGAKGPFYDPVIGHRGADYRRAARQTIPAYEPGVVAAVQHTGGLGNCVTVRLRDGRYAGWAHLVNVAVREGEEVVPGTVLGYAAGYGDTDAHGTLWDGAHIHTTLGANVGAGVGILPLYDPAPRITAALASTAGGGTTPIEDDDMFSDQDRADAAESLRLLRLIVLAPSGNASPATEAETKYCQIVQGDSENAAEARRQGGVILGAIAPAPGESRP